MATVGAMTRTRRFLALVIVGLAAGCLGGDLGGDLAAPWARMVDLSHPFGAETVYWPTEEGFELERGPSGVNESGYYYEAHRFRGAEHGGTHVDAPIHFSEGGAAVDALALADLSGPAAVVEVTREVERDRDYLISRQDLLGWEEEHGRLPERAILLLQTGMSRFWPDRSW